MADLEPFLRIFKVGVLGFRGFRVEGLEATFSSTKLRFRGCDI